MYTEWLEQNSGQIYSLWRTISICDASLAPRFHPLWPGLVLSSLLLPRLKTVIVTLMMITLWQQETQEVISSLLSQIIFSSEIECLIICQFGIKDQNKSKSTKLSESKDWWKWPHHLFAYHHQLFSLRFYIPFNPWYFLLISDFFPKVFLGWV